MITLADLEKLRPVNQPSVDAHKKRMLAEMRAYRLKEIRESAGLTQQQLADRVGVTEKQVSKIENDNVANSKVSTLRSYLEALGGDMAVEFIRGDARIAVA